MKIYVASSWRNDRQPLIVSLLKEAGYTVYDFRHPVKGNNGFHWEEIDKNWQHWTLKEYKKALSHQIANEGFLYDYSAMEEADACVLVLPCGRSAHIEAGYFVGARKKLLILLSDREHEVELMYKMADHICLNIKELLDKLKEENNG